MSASVLVLRARGPQDVELGAVNSDATFFRSTFPKPTNYSTSDLELSSTSGQMGYGNTLTWQLQRTGDLVCNMMLYMTVGDIQISPSITQETVNATKYKCYQDANGITRFLSKVFVDALPYALNQSTILNIGGYDIEELRGDQMYINDKLNRTEGASFIDTAPTAHGGFTKMNPCDYHDFDGNLNYGVKTTSQNASTTNLTTPAGLPIESGVSSNTPISSGFRWAQYPATGALAGPDFQQFAYPLVNRGDTVQHIYQPLFFTCTSDWGNALPIIALAYHDTRIKTTFAPLAQVSILQPGSGGTLVVKDQPNIVCTGGDLNASLITRLVWLDDFERRSFALDSHKYLITERQFQDFAIDQNASRQAFNLYFSHPVKELQVYFRKAAYSDPSSTALVNNYWNFTMDGNPNDASEAVLGVPGYRQFFSTLNLSFNQQKVYNDGEPGTYFTWLLPLQYHSRAIQNQSRVATLPFAADPANWRPTGSVNFSRLDQVQLTLTFDLPAGKKLPAGTLYVIAYDFNFVKIVSGMAAKIFAS
ncbi:hypothetical protein WJX74_009847 [Apatococcus lobatus]|uniref:Major capsid protein n=1 Tax=Apatococcus lobatus TaxID=904363 RepID=A0AAW1R123_9CHLO